MKRFLNKADIKLKEFNPNKNSHMTPIFGRILSNLQNSRIGENKALVKASKTDLESKINALHDITELKNRIKARKLQIETLNQKTKVLKDFYNTNKTTITQE